MKISRTRFSAYSGKVSVLHFWHFGHMSDFSTKNNQGVTMFYNTQLDYFQ